MQVRQPIPEYEKERIIFRGGPSQVVNYNIFAICFVMFLATIFAPSFYNNFLAETYPDIKNSYLLISKLMFFVPIIWAFIVWLKVRCHRYIITTERLKEEDGVFSKTTEELELFRVKDITLIEPFTLRLFGCGNIVLDTSDKSTPIVVLDAIKGGRGVLDILRANVAIMRQRKGVREVD